MSSSRGVRRRFSGRAPGCARRTRYHCPAAPRGTEDCEGWYLFLNVKAAGRSGEFLEDIVSFRTSICQHLGNCMLRPFWVRVDSQEECGKHSVRYFERFPNRARSDLISDFFPLDPQAFQPLIEILGFYRSAHAHCKVGLRAFPPETALLARTIFFNE